MLGYYCQSCNSHFMINKYHMWVKHLISNEHYKSASFQSGNPFNPRKKSKSDEDRLVIVGPMFKTDSYELEKFVTWLANYGILTEFQISYERKLYVVSLQACGLGKRVGEGYCRIMKLVNTIMYNGVNIKVFRKARIGNKVWDDILSGYVFTVMKLNPVLRLSISTTNKFGAANSIFPPQESKIGESDMELKSKMEERLFQGLKDFAADVY